VRPRTAIAVLATAMLSFGLLVATGASARPRSGFAPRGAHVSGIVQPQARGTAIRAPGGVDTTCTTPGATNYMADCNTAGRPVNETWIATNGSTYVAGANDYNSYNGNADFGYYTSNDGKTWTDNGPLDLFAQGTNHAAGDPALSIDPAGVVYYAGIYFDYFDCSIGGVELARRDPSNGSWSYYQILVNSNTQFQDKPAVAVDSRRVYVAWTRYSGCFGSGNFAPIKVAVFPLGPNSVPPSGVLSVPGSTYSSGAALAPDGHGGFWIAWEEFQFPTTLPGSIWLAHWKGKVQGWGAPMKISPAGFQDLPSPLPSFAFRDNSFPAITLVNGQPNVVWCSYDSGKGRTYWWANGAIATVSNSGDDQFFPSVGTETNGQVAISWSQTNRTAQTFDQYLSVGGVVTKISTASSFPNQDVFFGGTFIGDYNGMAVNATTPHPIWTDLRRPDPQYGGKAQDAMVYSP